MDGELDVPRLGAEAVLDDQDALANQDIPPNGAEIPAEQSAEQATPVGQCCTDPNHHHAEAEHIDQGPVSETPATEVQRGPKAAQNDGTHGHNHPEAREHRQENGAARAKVPEPESGHDHAAHRKHAETHDDHKEHGGHPPGHRCEEHGCTEVGQSNYIEGHKHKHNPDGSCCDKLSGEAKADIDTRASHHKVHTKADPKHTAAKHVDHENHRHKAGEHSGSGHCAGCTPAEAKQHIETGDCASGNCGHEHHSKVGPTVDRERQHDNNRILKEQIPKPRDHKAPTQELANHDGPHRPDRSATVVPQSEDMSRHATREPEADQARRHEAETVRQQADLHAEAVQEQIARAAETERRLASDVIEPEPVVRAEVVEAAVLEEQHQHQAIEMVEAAASVATDPIERVIVQVPDEAAAAAARQELVQPLAAEESDEATLAPVEVATVAGTELEVDTTELLDDIQETHEVSAVDEELVELVETYSEPTLGTEMIVAAPELVAADTVEAKPAMPDLAEVEDVEAPNFIADGLVVETDSIEGAPEVEPSIAINLEQELPATREAATIKTSEQTLSKTETEITKEIPGFAAIEEQFKALEEVAGDRKPEVLSELHKSIANLHAVLHDSTGEINTEKMFQEFLRLLTLLGFERPGETLQMYMQRYGISMMDDMLARLFELLRQSRSMEAITPTMPSFTALPSDPQGTQTIGRAVLALLTKLHGVQRQELALAA